MAGIRNPAQKPPSPTPFKLFMIKVPRTFPIGGGWICLEALDAHGERRRRTVGGDGFEGCIKGAACFVPVAGAVCSKPLGISGPQQQLVRRELTLTSHDLEHHLGRGLANHHQSIDFARLDSGTSRGDSGF